MRYPAGTPSCRGISNKVSALAKVLLFSAAGPGEGVGRQELQYLCIGWLSESKHKHVLQPTT